MESLPQQGLVAQRQLQKRRVHNGPDPFEP